MTLCSEYGKDIRKMLKSSAKTELTTNGILVPLKTRVDLHQRTKES